MVLPLLITVQPSLAPDFSEAQSGFLSRLAFHQRPLQNQLLVLMLSAIETSHFVIVLRKANGLQRIALPSPYLALDLKASSSEQDFSSSPGWLAGAPPTPQVARAQKRNRFL